MIFTVLDKKLKKICTLKKAINIQWIQRWYSCGQFSIQLPGSINATDEWYYIICDERSNVGIIQQKIYSRNIKGKFLQISGFFMEHELSNVVIEHYTIKPITSPTPYYYDYLHRRIGLMIKKFLEEKDLDFYYEDNTSSFGKYTYSGDGNHEYDFEINNQDVMSAAYELSKINETSFIYTLDEQNWKKLKMLPSERNTKVVFGENQLENYTVTYDESNYKNCVRILGPTFNGEQINLDYKSEQVAKFGETEKWILLDNTGMSLIRDKVISGSLVYDQNITDKSEILQMLEANAKAELENYKKIVNVDIKIVDTGKYVYTKDFNIGDFITVRIDSLGIEEVRQIIEVSEVWKANKHEVYIELGESRQRNIDKAKIAVSQGSISKMTPTSNALPSTTEKITDSDGNLKATSGSIAGFEISERTFFMKSIVAGNQPVYCFLNSSENSSNMEPAPYSIMLASNALDGMYSDARQCLPSLFITQGGELVSLYNHTYATDLRIKEAEIFMRSGRFIYSNYSGDKILCGMNSSGRIQLGSTSSPAGADIYAASGYGINFYNGSALKAYVNSSGLSNSSDKRLKSNIEDIEDRYVQIADKLKPKTFKYNDDNSSKTNVGFIAQDLEAIISEFGIDSESFAPLSKDEEGYMGINYIQLIPILWAKVQQLSAEIEKLKSNKEDENNVN